MSTNQQSAVGFVSAIFRHRRLLLWLFFGTVALAILYSLVTKKLYESDMKILVQNARQPQVLTSSKGDTPQSASEGGDAVVSRVTGEIELLSDQDLLEQLVVYRSKLLPEDGPPPQSGSKDMARAITHLGNRFDIEPVKTSNVITLSYLDESPELAQKVLRELERIYLEKHVQFSRPAGSFGFFNEEASTYQQKFADAEKRLAEFRRQNQFVAMDKEETALDESLHSLQATILADQAQVQSVSSQVAELQDRMNATPKRIPTQETTIPNQQGSQNLIAGLTDLNNRRIQLLTRYKPTDRLVVEVDEQIKNTEQALADLRTHSGTERSEDNSPTWLLLEQQMDTLKVQRVGAAKNLQIHTEQAASYERRLDHLKHITPQNDALEREVEEMRGMSQSISDKRDVAKVEDLLDAEQFGNVAVAQQPTYSRQHVKPKIVINTLLGGVTGLFLCAAAIMILETSRSTILTPTDLESISDAPLLATIPETVGFDSIFNYGKSAPSPGSMDPISH